MHAEHEAASGTTADVLQGGMVLVFALREQAKGWALCRRGALTAMATRGLPS
jgi:hypothetical protein